AKLTPMPAWPASDGRQRPFTLSTRKVPLRVPTRMRADIVISASTQGLQDEHSRAGLHRIAEPRPVGNQLFLDEDVDVRAQATTLVAHVEGEARSDGVDLPHDLGDGRR